MPDPTSRLTEALEGRYRIERELGSGGMATVYLAEDLRHGRKIALKVLKPELAAAVGADRFLAEIRTTANLQHPHILPLHDSGEAAGFLFYVMPYVSGESLRDRLERERQLPVDEAVQLAVNLAEALDYAHRQGVIHRDIKPENVLMLDGQPVIADFGIALAAGGGEGGRLTVTGHSIGTPQYMSPEQAAGDQHVGPATDVFSLGCLLYETLAGEPPFTGATPQVIIGKIVGGLAPSVRESRPTVPIHVEDAVRCALQRLPADRFTTAADFARALTDPGFRFGGEAITGAARKAGVALSTPALWLAGVVLLLAGVGVDRWILSGSGDDPPVVQYQPHFAEEERPSPAARPGGRLGGPALPLVGRAWWNATFAVTGDGARIAYVGPEAGGSRLWIRERDQLSGRPVAGTIGAVQPFFSPDGEMLGFVTEAGGVKAVSTAGGDPLTLVESGALPSGAAWGADGYVYFDSQDPVGLMRVADNGGAGPEPVFPNEVDPDVIAHAWPVLLPRGEALLVTVVRNVQQDFVAALDIETGTLTPLVDAVRGIYASTGHLLYTEADGSLFAARFDERKLTLTGAPVLVRELGSGFGSMAISSTGRFVYSTVPPEVSAVVWVDRAGNERQLDPSAPLANVRFLALSPDETKLAVSTRDALRRDQGQVWLKDLVTGALTRITFEGEVNYRPAWFPDSRRVLFISDRGETRGVWARRSDGSGDPELLVEDGVDVDQAIASPDGRWLVYRRGMQDGKRDIYKVPLGSDEAGTPAIATEFDEFDPALSPDGRWLAYVSLADGQHEIYVRPFPEGNGRWRVSRNGGLGPRWAREGQELFYMTLSDSMAVVDVLPGDPIAFGEERALFSLEPYLVEAWHHSYDVTADGERFAMIRLAVTEETAPVLVVVENFFTELKERLRH